MTSSAASTPVPSDGLTALDDPVERDAFTLWESDAAGARTGVSALRLSGMYCAACAGIIESALQRVDGVLRAEVNAASARAEVRWDPQRTSASALVAAVQAAGYGAAPDAGAPAAALRRAEMRRALWRLFVAGFGMMQVMMVAVPAYVAAPGEIDAAMLGLLNRTAWLFSVPVLVFSAGPFFVGAWQALRRRRIGMDVPVAIGIAVTFVASTGATFQPAGIFGHEVYFDSLTMFVFFLLAGRYLELRARHRVAGSLEDAVSRMPDMATRLDDEGRPHSVPCSSLRAGDRLRVAAGEAFAADGALVDGTTHADESLLTGESLPVTKAPGAALVAGSINVGAPVVMRVERVGADTRHAGIVALMRHALTERPAAAREADRWSGPFLWAVLVLAAGAAAVWSTIDPARAVWVAVAVLVVTCPCALSLATPSALLAAAGALSRRGVLLRRIEAIEALARVDDAFFDKTGTLTAEGLEPGVVEAAPGVVADAAQIAEWQRLAASLAGWSTHPAARAVAAALPAGDAMAWTDTDEQAGQGIAARLGDARMRLGRAAWVDPRCVDTEGAVWFGIDGRALLRIELREALRRDAGAAIDRLRRLGIGIHMLSGDTPERVAPLAQALCIDRWHAAATPAAKLAVIEAAQRGGHVVAMVGDGLNDAPVLARADVSIAFAHGAAVNRLHADAVLLGDSLRPVADAVAHARRTLRVIRQNLSWAALYNAACIPLALAGLLPPWLAGLGMAGSSLFVVLNALRLARVDDAGAR